MLQVEISVFFLGTRLFLLATRSKQTRQKIGCDFLPNLGKFYPQ